MSNLSYHLESPADIPLLAPYSFNSIIIDLPMCSIRSFSAYEWTYDELIQAKETLNSRYFVLNMDGIYSDDELHIIQTNFDQQFASLFSAIRIQDPGLVNWINSRFPNCSIQLNSETGNQHTQSLETLFQQGIDQITLNHEIPYSTIDSFSTHHKNLEIFVQGNILIQYSRRPFLGNLYNKKTTMSVTAEDPDFPKRPFIFLNTPFGHFMFAHFQRCLARYSDKLNNLSSCSWLIDARGQSADYKTLCCTLYSSLSTLSDQTINDSVNQLETISSIPQKPSFFLSNNTDYDWRDYNDLLDKHQCIGRVISVQKHDSIMVQFYTTIPINSIVLCQNPDQSFSDLKICPSDYSASSSTMTEPLELYTLPWAKGIQTKASLYVKDS